MKNVLPKLARWLGFTVIIAITPLLATYLALRAYGKPAGFSAVAGHGELLLIGSAIGAAAIGELIPFKTRLWIVPKILLIAFTLVLVLLSGMYFAFISLGISATNSVVVSSDSLVLFVFTSFLSGGCVALSEI